MVSYSKSQKFLGEFNDESDHFFSLYGENIDTNSLNTDVIQSYDTTECEVCGGEFDYLFSIGTISIHDLGWSIYLTTPEFRCLRHIYHVECSYCRDYIDGHNATIVAESPLFVALCRRHKRSTRCDNCQKWKRVDNVHGRHICECIDRNCKTISLLDIRPKHRRYDTRMSWRETLLRRKAKECYLRYLVAEKN